MIWIQQVNVIMKYSIIVLKKKQVFLAIQEMYAVQQYFALCDSSVCSIYESNLYNYNINILIQ